MSRKTLGDVTKRYEQYVQEVGKGPFVLRLYVTGASAASQRAVANLKALCEEQLEGRMELEVIDVFQQPELAKESEIIATPTLVKLLPPPLQRFVGDMSGLEGKLVGFEVRPKQAGPSGRAG